MIVILGQGAYFSEVIVKSYLTVHRLKKMRSMWEWRSRVAGQDNSQAVPFKVDLSDQTASKTSTTYL